MEIEFAVTIPLTLIPSEPIVESPKDAIMSFRNMNIDYLVMGNYLIS